MKYIITHYVPGRKTDLLGVFSTEELASSIMEQIIKECDDEVNEIQDGAFFTIKVGNGTEYYSIRKVQEDHPTIINMFTSLGRLDSLM